jgi:hypothetical protein
MSARRVNDAPLVPQAVTGEGIKRERGEGLRRRVEPATAPATVSGKCRPDATGEILGKAAETLNKPASQETCQRLNGTAGAVLLLCAYGGFAL